MTGGRTAAGAGVCKHRHVLVPHPVRSRSTAGIRGATLGGVLLVLVLAGGGIAGCGATTTTNSSPSTSTSTSTNVSSNRSTSAPTTSTTSMTGSRTSAPPAVPAAGAYLGAWLDPSPTGGGSFAGEQQAVSAVRGAAGRSLSILHLYIGWDSPAPVAELQAIAADGSIPLLDWGCAPDGPEVADGAYDARITAFAAALKEYGGPVLLRWCWEMNLVQSHPQVGGPSAFVDGWDHIRSIFTSTGATNVSFVWCPALTGVDPAPYFPGASEVDWIGVDGYDRNGHQTFTTLFGSFYWQWDGLGKPMMVAETGSAGPAQTAYIDSIGTDMPRLPGFKAVVYFDAAGPLNSWVFTPAGLQAFAGLARNPYFAP